MTNSAWWWCKRPTVSVDLPILVNPGDQTYSVGVPIDDLQIDNIGGDVDSWESLDLPAGLSITEANPRYCIIGGVVASGDPPVLVSPLDQTYYIGQVITDLRINNTGGDVVDWTSLNLPAGLSITEEQPTYCLINGTVETPSIPSLVNPGDQTYYRSETLNLAIDNVGGPSWSWGMLNMPDRFYLDDISEYSATIKNQDSEPLAPLDYSGLTQFMRWQYEPPDTDYIGHGPQCVEDWLWVEENDVYPPAPPGPDVESAMHYYDYGRSMYAAHSFSQLTEGSADPRWIEYGEADAHFQDWYGRDTNWRIGNRNFTTGMMMAYKNDPIGNAWALAGIRDCVETGTWCEQFQYDDQDQYPRYYRDMALRERSYALINYLDLFACVGESDPLWDSDKYADIIDACSQMWHQWMDECKEWWFTYPKDYLAIAQVREQGFMNIYELSPFASGFGWEAMLRYYQEDKTNPVDLYDYRRRMSQFFVDEAYNPATSQVYYRWWDCKLPCDGGPWISYCSELGTGLGQYWCEVNTTATEFLTWLMHQCGIMYSLTGDRGYITFGDLLWESAWTDSRRFRPFTQARNLGKQNTQILRYVFEYLRYRGDLPTMQTALAVATQIPAITDPTPIKKWQPRITDPGAIELTLNQAMTPIQMQADVSVTSWYAKNLPAGITIDNAGLISGTPAESSWETLSTIFASTSENIVSIPMVVTFSIPGPPRLEAPVDQVITAGLPFAYTFKNFGGDVDEWVVRDGWLPDGLEVTEQTSEGITISGTPT